MMTEKEKAFSLGMEFINEIVVIKTADLSEQALKIFPKNKKFIKKFVEAFGKIYKKLLEQAFKTAFDQGINTKPMVGTWLIGHYKDYFTISYAISLAMSDKDFPNKIF